MFGARFFLARYFAGVYWLRPQLNGIGVELLALPAIEARAAILPSATAQLLIVPAIDARADVEP